MRATAPHSTQGKLALHAAILLLAFLNADRASGRIGSTLGECIERYGNPLESFSRDQKDIHVFAKQDFTIEISLKDGRASLVSYRKVKTPLVISGLSGTSLADWQKRFGASTELLRRADNSVLHRFNVEPIIIESWFKGDQQDGKIRYLSQARDHRMLIPKQLLAGALQEWEKEFGSAELVQEREGALLYEWADEDRRLQAWFVEGKQQGWPQSLAQSELSATAAASLLDKSVFSAAERETLIKNNVRASIIEHQEAKGGSMESYAIVKGRKIRIAVFDPRANILTIEDPATVLTETVEEQPETTVKDL